MRSQITALNNRGIACPSARRIVLAVSGQARRELGGPVRFDLAAPHLRHAMKPDNGRPKTKRRQSIATMKMHDSTWALRLGHTAKSACFTYFSLLDFRDSYHARSRFLDHLNSDAFDY